MHTEPDDNEFEDDERDDWDSECPDCMDHPCRCCIDCGAPPGIKHTLGCLGGW